MPGWAAELTFTCDAKSFFGFECEFPAVEEGWKAFDGTRKAQPNIKIAANDNLHIFVPVN